MWFIDFCIHGVIFWFIMEIYLNRHIIKLYNLIKNYKKENKTERKTVKEIYTDKYKKYEFSDYNIEKIYAIKFNHISKFRPYNNTENGFIWLNTSNNTINIYNNYQFHEFPILHKSIIRQYIKRPIKNTGLNNIK